MEVVRTVYTVYGYSTSNTALSIGGKQSTRSKQ